MSSQDVDDPTQFENNTPDPNLNEGRPLSRWQKFRMVVKVVELRLRFIALMAATGLVFAYWDTLWNYYDKWARPVGDHVAAASDIEYYCPMHPSVVRDAPGNCPICGMPLSKRKKSQKEELPEGVTARVQLAPFRVTQAGIRTAEITYEPLVETVTTVGFVTFDERRLSRISSKTKGLARVEKLFVNFTGTFVEVGEPLADLYSPELYQATRELLLAQRTASERTNGQTALGQSFSAIAATWLPWPATSSPCGGSPLTRLIRSWQKGRLITVSQSWRPSVAMWFGRTSSRVSMYPRGRRCSISPT